MIGKMDIVNNKTKSSSCRICGEKIKGYKRIVVHGGSNRYGNSRKFYYHVDCVQALSIKAGRK